MARWRRLERMGSKLVRCSQVGHSTKGDIVSDPNFLAIHPYRKKARVPPPENDGKAGVVIGDSFQYGYEPPDALTEKTMGVSYQIWPYTEEWGRWIAAGSPDDWNHATRNVTITVDVVEVAIWYKELSDVADPTDPMVCFGYEVHSPSAQPLPDSDEGGGKMDYDEGYFIDVGMEAIGSSYHYIDPMTGERRIRYQWIPKYTDYFFAEGLAKVRVTEKFSEVTYPSGRTLPEEKVERMEYRKVSLTVRHHHDALDTSDGWLEFLEPSKMYEGTTGSPPVTLEKEEASQGEDTYVWENIDDPDNPRGIDYRKGAA